MDLLPDDEERGVIDATYNYLSGDLPAQRLHAADGGMWDRALRIRLAELGWFGIALAQEQGGVGMTLVDEVLVMREAGRFLAPAEVIAVNLAAKLAAAAGKSDLVQQLVAGEVGVALGVATTEDALLRVFGWHDAHLLLDITGANWRLLSIAPEDVAGRPCLDKSISLGVVSTQALSVVVTGSPLMREARLLCAAMQVGCAEAVTHMIVDYAKDRTTFGRPIGAYQAVRHPCAEMAVRNHAASAQLFLAAVAARDDRDDADLQANAAKLLADEAARTNTDANIQLHGGIGTTDEHDAHLFMKRAQVLSHWFGRQTLQRELVGA
ncbi:acyl-CoA dehydrogenase family protein [Pseudomonas sp. NFX224]|uniref:acyl-CoA dehydrogenase family protein n=1 Tax=Pseudomonas sp. NFX224 TaxID=3402862 RepID=UPI003AFB5AB9